MSEAMGGDTPVDVLPLSKCTELVSDWSSLESQTLDQVILYLSDAVMTASVVWPADQGLSSVQLVCRHWFNRASILLRKCTLVTPTSQDQLLLQSILLQESQSGTCH